MATQENDTPDPRLTLGLVCEVLDVLEKHGYHHGDDQHVGRVVGCIGGLARVYAGEADDVVAHAGVIQ